MCCPAGAQLLTSVQLGSAAHERWFVVYPGVNISDDAWGAGAFRWDPFRAVLASQAVSLPVRVPA
jgi:hypothetical protein